MQDSPAAVRLDSTNACLWRGAEAIRLTPQAWAVLAVLIARAGELVTKTDRRSKAARAAAASPVATARQLWTACRDEMLGAKAPGRFLGRFCARGGARCAFIITNA
jgi:hypothetical protein